MNGKNTPSHGEQMGTGSMALEEESGSSDNRLSWNPNQFEETAAWKNGQEYTVTLRIQQTAPGEANILEMTGEPSEANAENPPTANGGEAEASGEGGEDAGYSNPAVGRAMQKRGY